MYQDGDWKTWSGEQAELPKPVECKRLKMQKRDGEVYETGFFGGEKKVGSKVRIELLWGDFYCVIENLNWGL